jgi:hypothetical protein
MEAPTPSERQRCKGASGQGCQGYAAREPIQAVHHVVGVDHRDDDQHGERQGEDAERNITEKQYVPQVARHQPGAQADDQRGGGLGHEADAGGDSKAIIHRAHQHEEPRRREERTLPDHRRIHQRQDGEKREENADSAHHRDAADVLLAVAGVVEIARREGNGPEGQHEQRSDKERKQGRVNAWHTANFPQKLLAL